MSCIHSEQQYSVNTVHPDVNVVHHQVSKVSDWLDEEAGVETPLEEFTSRLKVYLALLLISFIFCASGVKRHGCTNIRKSSGA